MEVDPGILVDRITPVVDEDGPSRPKKRTRNEEEWKRNKTKKARLKGIELRNEYDEVIVKGRSMRDVDCICSCSLKFSEVEKDFIYEQFTSKQSHSLQNEYLRGCTFVTGCRTFKNGKENREFQHFLRFDKKTVKVCQRYFLGIHGINRSRLRTQVLRQELDISDKRGKHPNHKVVTTEETRNYMRIFLSNLPARSSHYSIVDNPNRRYLSPGETIASLYRKFLSTYPTISEAESRMQIFRKIFNTEYNIKFGIPRTDKCATCEAHITKTRTLRLNAAQNAAQIQGENESLATHLRSAQIFYSDMDKSKTYGEDEFVLCFDFQQNIPLPSTNVNKEFYISQLWVCNFGIKDVKSGKTHCFVYSEHFANKGCNEVISCFLWYVHAVVPTNVKTLHIFCDNTFGQNKNRFVFSSMQYLANTRFERVCVRYPVPGHSRMAIDADFGRIAQKLNKLETKTYPSDITNAIINAQQEKPFQIVFVNSNFTDDLCDNGCPVVDVKDFKKALEGIFPPPSQANLNLLKVRELEFHKNTQPIANFSGRFADPNRPLRLFRVNVSAEDIVEKFTSAASAYDDYLPLANIKFQNVQDLLRFVVKKPDLEFYNTIYTINGEFRCYIGT